MAVTESSQRKIPGKFQETLRQVRRNWSAYLFLTPAMLHFLVFTLFAVSFAFYISFHEWNILEPDKPFVGLDNYLRLFEDRRFHRAAINTFLFLLGIPISLALSLSFALLLNIKIRGRAIYRTMLYIPVITPLVVTSIIWKWVYQGDYGLLNYYLLKFGIIKEKLLWLADPDLALPAVMIMGIWAGVGSQMVIYLAGLQSIPNELYDSAKVDGANGFRRLIHITIPLLAPTTFFLLVTSIIGTFQIFTQIYIMTSGGPLNRTTTIGYYLYEKGFRHLDMGYATAISFALFAMIFVFTLLQMKFTRGEIEY